MRNFKLLFLVLLVTFTSCSTSKNLLVGDVIGFSDDVTMNFSYKSKVFKSLSQTNPYNLLTNSDKHLMEKMILSIPSGTNTCCYYALDLGLDRIKFIRRKIAKNDPDTKYYVILLTDGLDNASIEVAKNNYQGMYKTTEKYSKKIQRKTKNVMGVFKSRQNVFKIFPILFTKGDIEQIKNANNMTDTQYDAYIRGIMEGYRGASKGTNAPEAIYGNDFNRIMSDFQDGFSKSGFSVCIPKGYLNKKVKIELKDKNGVVTSMEGFFKKKWFSYVFENITFDGGITATSLEKKKNRLKSTQGVFSKELLASFFIDGLQLNGVPYVVDKAETKQYVYENKYWMVNTEYFSQTNQRKDAYVLLILDGSRSFKENSMVAKEKAIEMIDFMTK